ncbi:membrane protein [Escherichia coli O145:H25 str. 07-3858]|nr:membrane protein [Escherichia coli O145:H25 str. 07-3858]
MILKLLRNFNLLFFNIELMPVNFFFRITVYFLSLLFIG